LRRLSEASRRVSAANDTNTSLLYEWPEIDAVRWYFSDGAPLALRAATGEVLAIEHDMLEGLDAIVTQEDAPWGLQRISQAARMNRSDDRAVNFRYTYDEAAGRGVDIYIIDTGALLFDFWFLLPESRCREQASCSSIRISGHVLAGERLSEDTRTATASDGTDVAGTAAGRRDGVAQAANLVAVRFMDEKRKQMAVVQVSSLLYPSNSSQAPFLDAAARSLCYVIAPGMHIASDYIGGVDSTTAMSDTSMATLHVAGLVAYIVSTEGYMSPEDMVKRIKEVAADSVVRGLRDS
ncbi:subtilisin-like protein, partial [Exidia glandulosa HHB12029]